MSLMGDVVIWPLRGAESVSSCRDIVTSACNGAGVDSKRIDDIRVITSELSTNAVVHGLPPFELRLRLRPDWLMLEVVDSFIDASDVVRDVFARCAEVFDQVPQGGGGFDGVPDVAGRGLTIVYRLSLGHCGVTVTTPIGGCLTPREKSVWAAVALTEHH